MQRMWLNGVLIDWGGMWICKTLLKNSLATDKGILFLGVYHKETILIIEMGKLHTKMLTT